MASCDVVQLRRIRRKVLIEGKPIELVAMQESLSVDATKVMPSQRPKYRADESPRVALFPTQAQLDQLARLSKDIGGWIVFDAECEETFVPLEEWIARHKKWAPA